VTLREYVRPRLTRIGLRPEETLLTGCKNCGATLGPDKKGCGMIPGYFPQCSKAGT